MGKGDAMGRVEVKVDTRDYGCSRVTGVREWSNRAKRDQAKPANNKPFKKSTYYRYR